MKEYADLLEFYSSEYYFIYSQLDKETWANKANAITYLERFWLSPDEFVTEWQPIQKRVFDLGASFFPGNVFQSQLRIFPFLSGLLLNQADFGRLQAFMELLTDDYFVIVQNSTEGIQDGAGSALRFKFPTNITWEVLMGGAFISSVLFEMPHNDYWLFGASGLWGKYTANDLETPLDLFGIPKDLEHKFVTTYFTGEIHNLDIQDSIPEVIKDTYEFYWR